MINGIKKTVPKIERPTVITSVEDLTHYYWTKTQLLAFLKQHHLPQFGSKDTLIERISLRTDFSISRKRYSKNH